jgi:hypothetical protein
MSSLVTNPPPPFSITPTQLAGQLHGKAYRQFQDNQALAVELSKFIWSNPANAQAQFNLFGTNAAGLCVLASAYVAFVAAATASPPISPMPEGWDVTPNSDGTVTVVPPTS